MKTLRNIVFFMLLVGGFVLLCTSVYLGDTTTGIIGMLAVIMSHLNDIENKLDNKGE